MSTAARHTRRHGRGWWGRLRGIQRSAYQRPPMTSAATTSRQRTGPRNTSETGDDIEKPNSEVTRAGLWIDGVTTTNYWTVCS